MIGVQIPTREGGGFDDENERTQDMSGHVQRSIYSE